jgi:hypothetical protein
MFGKAFNNFWNCHLRLNGKNHKKIILKIFWKRYVAFFY